MYLRGEPWSVGHVRCCSAPDDEELVYTYLWITHYSNGLWVDARRTHLHYFEYDLRKLIEQCGCDHRQLIFEKTSSILLLVRSQHFVGGNRMDVCRYIFTVTTTTATKSTASKSVFRQRPNFHKPPFFLTAEWGSGPAVSLRNLLALLASWLAGWLSSWLHCWSIRWITCSVNANEFTTRTVFAPIYIRWSTFDLNHKKMILGSVSNFCRLRIL